MPGLWFTTELHCFDERGCVSKLPVIPGSHSHVVPVCFSFDASFLKIQEWPKDINDIIYFLRINYCCTLYLQGYHTPKLNLMEQNQQDYLSSTPNQFQPPLPNATTVLVLGILSIVICFITGIIALVLAKKDMDLYRANPTAYSEASLSNLKAGRICAIIGIILQGLGLLIYILFFVIFFAAVGASGGFN
jgi:hypothetical protein